MTAETATDREMCCGDGSGGADACCAPIGTRPDADESEVVPGIEGGAAEHAVRRFAFLLLLDEGEPVDVAGAAEAIGRPHREVADAAEHLASQGRLRRDDAGRIVGVAGLSIEPTRHRIEVDGNTRYTWCAIDAVGILGALGRGGRVTSTPPDSSEPLEVVFAGADPSGTEAAIFVVDQLVGESVVEAWCPQVNFFSDMAAAHSWAGRAGVDGRVLSIAEATELASEAWRRILN